MRSFYLCPDRAGESNIENAVGIMNLHLDDTQPSAGDAARLLGTSADLIGQGDFSGVKDAMYNSLFRELLTYMMEDPRNIGLCTHLLFGAKNLERIGDHATNIAEIIHFEITGEEIISKRPKLDTPR